MSTTEPSKSKRRAPLSLPDGVFDMKSEKGHPSCDSSKWFLPAIALLIAAGLSSTGCHKRPPLLGAPGALRDLTSIRAGDQVEISWTIPHKTMDKLIAERFTTVQVCRRESTTGPCTNAGEPLKLGPDMASSFSEMLPAELASGTPRVLTYSLQLINREDQSARISSDVVTIAGAPPPPLNGLTADLQSDGVLLRWPPISEFHEPAGTIVRLYRRLLKSAPTGVAPGQIFRSDLEPQDDLTLEADANKGCVLDRKVRPGKTYEYLGQRVVRVALGGRTLDLTGELSVPARIVAGKGATQDPPAGMTMVSCVPAN
jgi:hypothetical protein